MQKQEIDVKIFKLIAYLELLRKSINISPDEDHPDYFDKDKLNTYYHELGNIRYALKKMLGHYGVTDSYVVDKDTEFLSDKQIDSMTEKEHLDNV